MPALLGRFELRRELGRGGQSIVYLGWDPKLEREVAIKTLAHSSRSPTSSLELLREARLVAGLKHPNIVPVFEAGEQDGLPHLVFERIVGRTLAQTIRDDGPLSPATAVDLMHGVLQALEHAHKAGIVHRDLKPSNVLIDVDGSPRVMDFGIAGRIDGARESDEALRGTPCYLAPEYIRSRTVGPQNDLFAAGLMLFECVFGKRAYEGSSVFEVMHRIVNEPLVFPSDAEDVIDGALHDLIAKATARDPELRFASATEMREALERYRNPIGDGSTDTPGGDSRGTTLEFLLRRMRHKSDFPAMSTAISSIFQLATSDTCSPQTLSNAILKDFALTNKILRIVNSASYHHLGGRISTVSRAIMLLGFNAVRNIAISLMLFEHVRDKQHAERLREEFLKANLCGMVARGLAESLRSGSAEEAYICALFHNLGRLLTCYYFPEESEAIERLMKAENVTEAAASRRVLGIGYADLGMGVAKSWGFPDEIQDSMCPLPAQGKLPPPASDRERQRLFAALASEVCQSLGDSSATEARCGRYREALGLSRERLGHITNQASEDVRVMAKQLNITLHRSRFGRLLSGQPLEKEKESEATPSLPVMELPAGSSPSQTSPVPAQSILAAGIQEVSQALVENVPLGDVLNIVLETMHSAIGFQRTLIALRDGRSTTMQARYGFGDTVDADLPHFRFGLGGNDLFNLILGRDVDVLISDAGEPKIAARLPEWYRRHFAARSFILFPLRLKETPIALIYADKAAANSLILPERELALLRSLRNQALLALRQQS